MLSTPHIIKWTLSIELLILTYFRMKINPLTCHLYDHSKSKIIKTLCKIICTNTTEGKQKNEFRNYHFTGQIISHVLSRTITLSLHTLNWSALDGHHADTGYKPPLLHPPKTTPTYPPADRQNSVITGFTR